jgi:hypothetical protein
LCCFRSLILGYSAPDKFLEQMATPLLLVNNTSTESPPDVPFDFREL